MNASFSPFVKMISRVNLFYRFLFITLIVALTLLYLVSSIIKAEIEDINITQRELKGSEVVIQTIQLLNSLQDLRNLAVRKEVSSEAVSKEKIEESTARIDKYFSSLGDLVKKNPQLKLQDEFNSLENSWSKVKQKQDVANVDKFRLYDDYIDEPKSFLKVIGANAGLNLDIDNDSYYLIQIVGSQLPETIEYFSMLRDLIVKSLYTKSIDQNMTNYLGYTLAGFELNLDLLKTNLSFIGNNDIKTKENIQDLLKKIDLFNIKNLIENSIYTKKFDQNFEQFNEKITSIANEYKALFLDLSKTVKSKLLARDAALKHQIYIKTILFLVITGFVSIFFMAFYRSTKNSLNSAVSTATEIAQGNLTSEIYDGSKDEFKSLFDAFSEMQESLSEIVSEISDVGNTVNSSASEIAAGNANLSERTQSQASALVETAASLNNLTDTVRKNAESAREATNLANKSSSIAEHGKNAVGKVLVTMGEINESAQKIQEITSVIDSIAFQTNLLALNASVEAARAGEQGRGFAVVASEVRNLAQRSADAAKQIKELINDSMIKVDAGDKQVKLTADTMQDILSSITQVNDIVKLISIASTEQSNGIDQINIVVSEMEETTQKNAALVEEAAASAELLEKQSGKLVSVMERFNI